jgi:DNA segregation ATPase FtsK/SpoIIIE-like protein
MLREARAFGLYFAAMGQSWSHRELSPSLRQQFRTGLHFGTNDPASSRMIVNSSAAVRLMTPGRALASLPFGLSGGVVELQTPYLDAATALTALAEVDSPPETLTRSLPEPAVSTDEAADAAFRELVVGKGLSRREAALTAYGKEYAGAIVTRGKRALGEI